MELFVRCACEGGHGQGPVGRRPRRPRGHVAGAQRRAGSAVCSTVRRSVEKTRPSQAWLRPKTARVPQARDAAAGPVASTELETPTHICNAEALAKVPTTFSWSAPVPGSGLSVSCCSRDCHGWLARRYRAQQRSRVRWPWAYSFQGWRRARATHNGRERLVAGYADPGSGECQGLGWRCAARE